MSGCSRGSRHGPAQHDAKQQRGIMSKSSQEQLSNVAALDAQNAVQLHAAQHFPYDAKTLFESTLNRTD